ncbi:MAG: response regulator [Chitinophagaceae bacterium]|nr:response regulator [Chitinophagaceae bacterium]
MHKPILLYDDDREILEVCRLILERNGYQVIVRANCSEVIGDTETVKPGLIFMDLWIPEHGGEEAIFQLKAHSMAAFIPVFLFSANDNIEAIAIRCSANGFLRKPFSIAQLLTLVADNLQEATS